MNKHELLKILSQAIDKVGSCKMMLMDLDRKLTFQEAELDLYLSDSVETLSNAIKVASNIPEEPKEGETRESAFTAHSASDFGEF